MIQPIGYYTRCLPGENSLLEYIQETYGPFCEGITLEEKLFLVYNIAQGLCILAHREGVRDEMAVLAIKISGELSLKNQEGMLEALVNQVVYDHKL